MDDNKLITLLQELKETKIQDEVQMFEKYLSLVSVKNFQKIYPDLDISTSVSEKLEKLINSFKEYEETVKNRTKSTEEE